MSLLRQTMSRRRFDEMMTLLLRLVSAGVRNSPILFVAVSPGFDHKLV